MVNADFQACWAEGERPDQRQARIAIGIATDADAAMDLEQERRGPGKPISFATTVWVEPEVRGVHGHTTAMGAHHRVNAGEVRRHQPGEAAQLVLVNEQGASEPGVLDHGEARRPLAQLAQPLVTETDPEDMLSGQDLMSYSAGFDRRVLIEERQIAKHGGHVRHPAR
jgi:hypothetical protein